MTDLWGFLLQTLTVSGAAALLLAVKAVFRDKLSPRWQAAAWGVLGLVLLVPAGWGGRYVLINWPWLVETAKTLLTGTYTLTAVSAPIPLPPAAGPRTWADWLYLLYLAGVLALLGRYLVSYIRLRAALRRGQPAGEARTAQIAAAAERYGLTACPAVEVPGLSSAFICGLVHPVLALPAGETDEKVLLHELLHLQYRDVLWGLVLCLARCVHWCNPLLWYCANQAGNDLEALCDQRVLERLEGEERREYGRILLSMADEVYARAPGTSSMANGGRNIRRRIEAIARFKKYPAGMALASVCVTVVLALPLLLGQRAQAVYTGGLGSSEQAVDVAMASARTTYCTTYAGALDAYAKAVLAQNGVYRAMCAPLSQQQPLAQSLQLTAKRSGWPNKEWNSGLPAWPNEQRGYVYYNLVETEADVWEALLVVELNYPPEGRPAEENTWYLAVQSVQAEREGRRWVVTPLEAFRAVETQSGGWDWGCEDLPAWRYQGTGAGFQVAVLLQTSCSVDSTVTAETDGSWFLGPQTSLDLAPRPGANFDILRESYLLHAACLGGADEQSALSRIGVSYAPMGEGEERPTLQNPEHPDGGGSSTDGSAWSSRTLEEGWGPTVRLGGGGSGGGFPFSLPGAYAADLYLNDVLAAELTLLPVEGGPQ